MPRRIRGRMAVATVLLAVLMVVIPTSVRALDIGDQAPDFLAFDTVGEAIRLSDYQGKKHVLMFFFVRAFVNVLGAADRRPRNALFFECQARSIGKDMKREAF